MLPDVFWTLLFFAVMALKLWQVSRGMYHSSPNEEVVTEDKDKNIAVEQPIQTS